MNLELVDNITQLSPPAALAAALWVVGNAIKKSRFENWLIPFVLPLLGALAFPFIAETANVNYQVRSPMLFNGLIGMAIGGAATGLDQMFGQWLARTKNLDGKTSFVANYEETPPATKPDETSPAPPPSPPAP